MDLSPTTVAPASAESSLASAQAVAIVPVNWYLSRTPLFQSDHSSCTARASAESVRSTKNRSVAC